MTSFAAIDWYETPAYYDLVFDEDTQREADFVEAAMKRYAPTRARGKKVRRVLEPACGSGRMVAELSRRGFRVEGFDASEAMLAFARNRLQKAGLKAGVRKGRMEAFAYKQPFQLVHCLVSTFKYLSDEQQALAHLECVAACLETGGLYLLGLHLTDYANDKCTRERWVVEKEGLKVVCNTQTWPAESRSRSERVRTRLLIEEMGDELQSETNWNFRTYDAKQLRRLLAKVADLTLVAVHDFHYDIEWTGDLADDAFDVLLVLRKDSPLEVDA
jgi:SAM-dependent methyltransferase